MKQFRIFNVFILVSFFGLSFMAEAFASSEFQHLLCDSKTGVATAQLSALGPSVVKVKTDQQNSEKSPCNDPCHFGFSHFGHSAIALFARPVYLAGIELMKSIGFRKESMVESTYVKSLRRPPRLG